MRNASRLSAASPVWFALFALVPVFVCVPVVMLSGASLGACGPLANDPVAGDAGSSGTGNGGGDSGTPVTSHDSGGGQGSPDASSQGGHDSGAAETGGPEDSGGGMSDDTGTPPVDSGPPPVCTPVTTWTSGSGISNAGWTATATPTPATDGTLSDAVTANAFDNSILTRWSSGQVQSATAPIEFTLDLGSAQSVSQVVLFDTADGGGGDFPAQYTLGLSSAAGGPFTTVASGSGALITSMCFTAQSAQYLQVTATATSTSWFSIYEIQVFP